MSPQKSGPFGFATRYALSEAVIIHAATGAALGGMRPVAEIQFGGFAALAMNALINNAAQIDGGGVLKCPWSFNSARRKNPQWTVSCKYD